MTCRPGGAGSAPAARRCGRSGKPGSPSSTRPSAASSCAASSASCRPGSTPIVARVCEEFRAKNAKLATRVASGDTLNTLVPAVPELIGGSADLTPSNNTKAKDEKEVRPGDFSGRYIHFGVREMGMAAAMNGIAAHGGLIPYGGTFLTFTDYARGAIRLSALMEVGVVYVMTHDSIGLGEDGPTHQPVEHLAALRAIPHLQVFRPCDAVETAECWYLALESRHAPSILALTRQGVAAAAHRAAFREPLAARRLCAG